MKRHAFGVSCEFVIEGGEEDVLKFSQQMIKECGVNVLTLILMVKFFCVLLNEFSSSKGAVHSGMVGVQPSLIGQTKGTGMTCVYCAAVRTISRWTLWTPLWGILIKSVFLVRRR